MKTKNFFYEKSNFKEFVSNISYHDLLKMSETDFISWAKNNPGVKEIMLGTTSGIGDTERTKKLYERMGVVRIGDTFVLPQE